LLFVFSFSFINYAVSDLIIVFLGFRYGLMSSIIKQASFSVVGIGNSLSYWIIRMAVLLVVTFYSCKIAFYSLSVRKFSKNGRLVINNASLLRAVLLTIMTVGSVLILEALYCVFVFVF